jgi:predicted kinase
MNQFLLQMAGIPGSGKSAIARGVGACTNAVVLDKDLLMAAMMRSGVPDAVSGGAAYELGFDLARAFLSDGHNVILDTPANFVAIREKGSAAARQSCAGYFIIECQIARPVAGLRIASREPLHALHPVSLEGLDLDFERPDTAPLCEPHLALDTAQDFDACLKQALEYIGYDAG